MRGAIQRNQTSKSGENGTGAPRGATNGGDSLIISYNPAMKLAAVFGGVLTLPLLYFLATGDEFVLHLLAVAGTVTLILYLIECLTTWRIILEQDRIVKRRLFFGETIIPARQAVLAADQQVIRFFYGSATNRRERITILRMMTDRSAADAAIQYARAHYHFQIREEHSSDGNLTSLTGSGGDKEQKVPKLSLDQFEMARGMYGIAPVFMVSFAVIVVIVVGVTDTFDGIAPTLPVNWFRIGAVLLAVAAYIPLRRLNPADAAAAMPEKLTWNLRCNILESNSRMSMMFITGVALLGLLMFFLCGNLLDFYLFLAVGVCYYIDFYPRLSAWERIHVSNQVSSPALPPLAPTPSRRRSLQVSLVLLGALAASSYGENQQYLYRSKKDCMDDWGSDKDCQEPSQGSPHYRSGYYYGPRYGGYGRGARSVGMARISRGGFGSLGSFHGSFGG